MLDEEIQLSQNDELTSSLVESFIKVVNCRYEIPVPFKYDIIKVLPNNYNMALKQTLSLSKSASRSSQMQTPNFAVSELLTQGWIAFADKEGQENQANLWHLPYFVKNNSAEPRVVYDGAAMTGGVSINQAVLAGENLLNGFVDVLMRLRLGRCACVTDVSKCFFQIKSPRSQQDWSYIIWFKNNNIDDGETKVFCFTRYVWGINSSLYVALSALKRLVAENPQMLVK